MMKKHLLKAFAVAALSLVNIYAMAAPISGHVQDANGEPLIGVSVSIEGTSEGTITDIDGNYAIDANSSDQLTFSYVGFMPISEAVGARKVINVTLKEDRKALSELVVVGYGTQKKANLTGAVASVNVEEDLSGRPLVNIGQGLQGTTPGLTITNQSGKLGAAPEFHIRGAVGSLSGGSQPLILLNGSEIADISLVNPDDIESISVLKDAASASIYGSRASFGVILITTKSGAGAKDKMTVSYNNNFSWSAPTYTYNQCLMSDLYKMNMAMYGGAGTSWGGLVVNQQAYEGALNFEKQYGDGSQLGDEMLLGRDFDVLDDGTFLQYRRWDVMDKYMSKNAFGQSHNLSVDGNTGKANYHLGLGYMGQDGLFTPNQRHIDRYNMNFSTNINVNKWLKVKTEMIYSHSDLTAPYAYNAYRNNGYADNELAYMLWFPYHPYGTYTVTAADVANNTYIGAHYADMVGQTMGFDNGASEQSAGYTAKTMKDYLKATVGATFILGTPDLTLDIDYSFNYNTENMKSSGGMSDPLWYTWGGKLDTKLNGYGALVDTRINENQTSIRYHVGNAVLRYAHTWNEKHAFAAMVGMNIESRNYRYLSTVAGNKESLSHEEQCLVDGNYYMVSSAHDGGTYRTAGVFARINYAYDNRYLIELNGRYDGSSKFQKGNKWGFFPSGSIGWVASSEDFWSALDPYWSFAKLRLSYGSIGNQNVDANLYRQLLAKGKSMWMYNEQNQQAYGLPTTIREAFTWENIATVNAGADLRFFHDDLGLSFDWYQRNTNGMIVNGAELPATFGASAPKENAGFLQTRGYELQLDYHHKFKCGLGITASAALSDSKTKILSYANRTLNSGITVGNNYYEGGEYGELWGLKVDRLFQEDDFNADGSLKASIADQSPIASADLAWAPGDVKYQDLDGDGKISFGSKTYNDHGDLTKIGNTTPRYEYNFKLGLDYFGFDVSLFFQGVGKKDYWATGYMAVPGYYEGGAFFLAEHLDYWRPDNTNAYWPRLANFGDGNAQFDANSHNFIPNDRYMLNMAYCRLKNVTIGYSLPQKALDKMHFEKFRVYFQMENIATIDHMNGLPIDPETGDNEEDCCWGMGWGQVSNFTKGLSCGLQITF